MAFKVPNDLRLATGPAASTNAIGNNGVFRIGIATMIASDDGGWEHVSVSLPGRCPSWQEMCEVKSLFWDPEDCAIQFHPAAAEYVNCHPFCLHLWRPTGGVPAAMCPPTWMVGPTQKG